VAHGFLRAKDADFTIFNAPGAGIRAAFSLNPKEEITGIIIDDSNVSHGFLRGKHEDFTTFDAPSAGNQAGQCTRPEFIDAASEITGFYYDENNVGHGFLRTPYATLLDRQTGS